MCLNLEWEKTLPPSPECVIFMGCPASGKSSFYREHFYDSHVRLNLDMLSARGRLRTGRGKEDTLLEALFQARQSFVVDNTNPEREIREKYIRLATEHGFRVTGIYFESNLYRSFSRNSLRTGLAKVPWPAFDRFKKRFNPPTLEEGFTSLWYVSLSKQGFSSVKPLDDEARVQVESWKAKR